MQSGLFLILSAVLHGAIVVVAIVSFLNRAALVAKSSGLSRPIEVEIETARPLPPEPEPAAVREPTEPADQRPEQRPEPNPRADLPRRPDVKDTAVGPAPTGTATPQADEYSGPPDQRPVIAVPGIGGPAVWAMPGVMPEAPRPAPAPTVAPKPREVDKDIAGQVVREAMRKKDKGIGIDLPAAGSVASAVQSAVYASDIPSTAKGTIAIRLGPNGEVLGVKVVSMAGGSAEVWERIAQAAAARLRGRNLSLTSEYAKGATVFVDAVSMLQMPAGNSSGAIKPAPSGASFDLSNIGAHQRQVVRVSTRVVPVR